ncbi:hypothetical protein [Streptomyces lydicus]|uniref:hypothetical protein n=1 Tax=Streptomyces lydicus TaxID=47763 RepID=UPI0010130427|nr:hypothetical protein [Streptomyces lydicus]MCZ1005641.1 hypothetical protein [Streptomyces lydicus]
MKVAIPVPLTKCAYDDPATRDAFERARRGVLINLLVRAGVWLALLVVAKVVETDSQLVEGTAAFLLVPAAFLLVGPAKAVRWMGLVQGVLKSFPWQRCEVVRRQDAKVGAGTGVQLGLGGSGGSGSGEPDWTPVMAARTWRRRTRWSPELEGDAWFAGAPDQGGVIARPGGHGLMTLRPQGAIGTPTSRSGERTPYATKS